MTRCQGLLAGHLFFLVIGLGGPPLLAADWPTWRRDAHRSAATSEQLPEELHLQWVRRLPPTATAWPTEPRSQFDASYEPVVLGNTVFLGSPNDDCVLAMEAETGSLRWKFHADGPVRFAPVADGRRVYFGSDDGYLYCLNAADGTLVWKFRAGPKAKTHLGNERLISFWPVRGGPVLRDGKVYFAAGIWPLLGVLVHAVDVETGKAVWTNAECHWIEDIQLDHDFRGPGGISPQGYLVATEDHLVVPNGRSMPAYLDRATGKLVHYTQGWKQGNCRVAADGRIILVGNYFYPFQTLLTGRNDAFFMVRAHPGPSEIDASAFSDQFLFGLRGAEFLCYEAAAVAKPEVRQVEEPPKEWWKPGYKYAGAFKYQKLISKTRWTFDASRAPGGKWCGRSPSTVLIKAGDRLYGSSGKTLMAVALPGEGKTPTLAWSRQLEETPSSLVAANGQLLVATTAGSILCFGAKPGEPIMHEPDSHALPPAEKRFVGTAREILKATNVSEGYCVVAGVGSGQLAAELLRQSKLRLVIVEQDKKKADAFRDQLIAAGLYGPRAQVLVGNPGAFPFPPYLADMIVSEDCNAAGLFTEGNSPKNLFRTLRPLGGVACLKLSDQQYAKLQSWVAEPAGAEATLERSGPYVLLGRPGALPGSADWSHGARSAANDLFCPDTHLKPPLGVLWYGDSDTYGFHGPKIFSRVSNIHPKVCRGRLFAVARGLLHAVDVYTGRHFWRRELPVESGGVTGTKFVPRDDSIYLATGRKCLFLDAATGHTRKVATYDVKSDQASNQTPVVKGLFIQDDVILILYGFADKPDETPTANTFLLAADRTTGKKLWSRRAKHSYNTNSMATRATIAMGGGKVFLIDTPLTAHYWQKRRRGESWTVPANVMALDARTGKVLWQQPSEMAGYGQELAYSAGSGVLLLYRHLRNVRGLDPNSGKPLWKRPLVVHYAPLMVGPKTFYAIEPLKLIHVSGFTVTCNIYDVMTGQPVKKDVFQSEQFNCNYALGAENLMTRRDVNMFASCVDMKTGKKYLMGNTRSGCTPSLIPANGLIVSPGLGIGCNCNYPLQTAYGLAPMPEVAEFSGWRQEERK